MQKWGISLNFLSTVKDLFRLLSQGAVIGSLWCIRLLNLMKCYKHLHGNMIGPFSLLIEAVLQNCMMKGTRLVS